MTTPANVLTIRLPLTFRRRGGRKTIITPDVLAAPPRQDVTLVKAVARAFRWRRMLETGRYATVRDLAASEKINASYVSRVLRITLLAPDLVEAILDGRQPEGMTLPALLEPFPGEWKKQRTDTDAPTAREAREINPCRPAPDRPCLRRPA